MIGQKMVIDQVANFLTSDNTTGILIGKEGSGKKTLLRELLYNVPSVFVEDTKKDTIKDLISTMYMVKTPMIYVIPDIESMSVAAMNSLLKVTEEPPNNAMIVLTCTNLGYVLPTLQSRSMKFYMQPYTKEELKEYCNIVGLQGDEDFVLSVCDTPGEIDKLGSSGVDEFKKYVYLVFDNIAEVSGTNALKIGSRLSLKEGEDGFNLALFYQAFMKLCQEEYINTKNEKYKNGIYITDIWLNDLRVKGINKSALFDTWVLEIRRLWMV